MDWSILTRYSLITKLLSSLILVLLILILRRVAVHEITRRAEMSTIARRRWVVAVRNITLALTMAVLAVVWFEQIRTVAATVMLIAAAIVVATKEFLLNLMGFVYRSAAKFISVGDRIEINGIRGDVIDQNFMGITVLEIGSGVRTHQYTGLTVYIPNSNFLSSPVKNETHLGGKYVFHVITVPLKAESDWKVAEQALLKAGEEICRPYLEEARGHMKRLATQYSLDAPTVDPRVNIQISDAGVLNLVLRLAVPSRRRGRLEQDAFRKYLLYLDELKENPAGPQTEPHNSNEKG